MHINNTILKISFSIIIALMGVISVDAQNDDQLFAKQLIEKNSSQIGLSKKDVNDVLISDTYIDNLSGMRMVYLQQSYLDLPIYNQLQVLAFKDDQLVAQSGSRLSDVERLTLNNKGVPEINAEQAVWTALKDRKMEAKSNPLALGSEKNGHYIVFDDMGVSQQNITAELMWVPLKNHKKLVLAWQIYIVPVNSSDYWMVRVNAIDNSIVGVSNFTVYCNWDDPNKRNTTCENIEVENERKLYGDLLFDYKAVQKKQEIPFAPSIINSATYRVVPYPAESPIHTGGTPALVTNPWTSASGNATSLKWHSNGTSDYNYTRGNNVWAQEDRNGNNGTGIAANSTNSNDPLSFDFTPNFAVSPTQTTPVSNQQFNITNLFYWNNIVHDLSYVYGFDEVSGNFQASNQGRGGFGNDFVYADAQDGYSFNNANFSTPPDGGNGRMQMFLWSGSPYKDGDVDNGVVAHEFAHGISNRLTGGPAMAGCLENAEQMGEGWSDYYALMYTQNWATSNLNTGYDSPRGIGTYVIGQTASGSGIRTRKYSTNFSLNNTLVYAASIDPEPHNNGEIWCAALWDMTWNIINQVGYITKNLYNADSTGGNVIALKLVTLGMKLQPCSPGFIDGRDAILQADQILYNGAYNCAIREAFRRRGMGAFASQGSSESVTDQVPDYNSGDATLTLTQSVTQIPEGQNVTYTNKISVGNCGNLVNFLLTDTLPSNVTYVSGGNYNSTNRVVSFPVNLNAGQTEYYSFIVQVNSGSYFPTVSLFEDHVNSSDMGSTWSQTSILSSTHWAISTARSFSPDKSYFSGNADSMNDERLTLVNPIVLDTNPPPLTFRHFYNSESTYDGAVLEISNNGGATWNDMGNHILSGGYSTMMDSSTLLPGRYAWTGSSGNKFIKTTVDLSAYANQNVQFRFRFTSDDGTNNEGWYVDDIEIKRQAEILMRSNLLNENLIAVISKDTSTGILSNSCIGQTSTEDTTVIACDSYTWHGNTYTISGLYQWLGINANGCDSLVNLYLTIQPSSSSSEYAVACNSYTWKETTYTQSGDYNYITTNSMGCDSIITLHLTIDFCNYLQVKCFLEGYCIDNNRMNPSLFSLGLSTDSSITDSIEVQLWSPFDLNNAIPNYTFITFLHDNGIISITIPEETLGKRYYIVLKHRNSIETWSAYPVTINSFSNFDFTVDPNNAYSDGINLPMKHMVNGDYALYGGDINQDGTADATDLQITENDAYNFMFGYNTSDCNGDGASDATDMQIIENNANLFLFTSRPTESQIAATITDIDSNIYPIVEVCNQTWMGRNLNVSRYNNGDPIPQVTDPQEWMSLTSGAWCWFNNDSATYESVYGKLYNWYAVNDPRGLAPEGWHVTTDQDWSDLSSCLGGSATAGRMIKEAGNDHWVDNNIGTTNSSGLTILPSGYRFEYDGQFYELGTYCSFWTASEANNGLAFARDLQNNLDGIYSYQYDKVAGQSVRCVKNN